MHMLSKKSDLYHLGATKVEILNALNIKNRNKAFHFQNLLINLANYIEPLGLQINFNPLDTHWFISYESDVSDLIRANPFEDKPRLAASLFCALVCCLKNSGRGKIHEIEELRNKKSVLEDLKELEKRGYLEIAKDEGQVRITPLIGYQLDLQKLFIKLSLKLK